MASPGAGYFTPTDLGNTPARLCSALTRQLLADQPLTLKTPDSTKDYIFIDDLAAAILAVLEGCLTGPINLGTGVGVTVRDIARDHRPPAGAGAPRG